MIFPRTIQLLCCESHTCISRMNISPTSKNSFCIVIQVHLPAGQQWQQKAGFEPWCFGLDVSSGRMQLWDLYSDTSNVSNLPAGCECMSYSLGAVGLFRKRSSSAVRQQEFSSKTGVPHISQRYSERLQWISASWTRLALVPHCSGCETM